MEKNCKSCDALLEQIRAVDFAIVETGLYLDAYPNCQEALDYYHELIDKKNVLVGSYEHHCGPLTVCGNYNKDSWDWTRGPWPWELSAN